MRKTITRLLAWTLCLALVLSALPASAVGATQAPTSAVSPESKVIYATGESATFVPSGYTYVYEGANGQIYTRQAEQDVYVSSRVLTAQEAEALATLEYGQEGYLVDANGQTLVCKEFDAKEAAAYSDAVKAILGDAQISDGDKVSVLSAPYTSQTPVRALITFENKPVSQLKGMSVSLGSGLGTAELQAVKTIEAQQRSVIAKAEAKLGYDITINNQFALLTNAVSVTVNYGDLAAISKMDGVKSAILMPSYSIPEINAVTTDSVDFETNLKYAAPAMGADSVWAAGYKGEGMSVAVIDTGLCFENPSFSIEPSDPDSVAYTKDDIAEILKNETLHAEEMDESTSIDTVYYSSKVPFGFNYADGVANFGSDDDTWFGHGSHVAGIVAGNLPEDAKEEFGMETMGIAPEAQLVIMKVFDMFGMCYLDYLVAALEDAIVLGVDCANLSLGSPCGPVYYDDVTEVYDAAIESGINVVVSAGNDAQSGVGSFWGDNLVKSDTVSTGTVGMPGSFDSVLTVASAENEGEINFYGNTISWYNAKFSMRQVLFYEELPDVPEGKGFKENLETVEYEFTDSFADAEGKLVFYAFEGGSADSVVADAKKAGAAGVILYTPAEGAEWDMVEATVTSYDVPVCVTNSAQYTWMVQQEPPEGKVRVDGLWNPSSTAGQISSFSSWGPTDGLTLKPEITGIGGNVFSAYYGDYFAIASGTSMSSPAVAASAALLRQYLTENGLVSDGDKLNEVVNCLLMSTATPLYDEAHGTYYFVRQQGAGLVNVSAATNSGAYITVDGTNKAKLELGDDPDKTGTYEMTFNVVNFSDTDKTYTLDTTVLGQKAEGGQFKNGKITYLTVDYARNVDAAVTSSITDGTLTVPAGTTAEVTVTVTLADAEKAYYDERFPAGAYVEGFVQLLGGDATPNLTVPFLGFYGDFDAIPILEEGSIETTLAGERSYYTADQFHSGLWGYEPMFDDPSIFLTAQRYLGDTRAPGYVKVAQADYNWDTMWTWATEYYPEQAGFSPNGDKNLDVFYLGYALRRNAENIHYTVTNRETGEVLFEQDTGFMQKTYTGDAYAGGELSLEWLYPVEYIDWGGELIAVYDDSQVLLDNNTWVEIRADVTPEGATAPTDSVTFTVYIDQDEPVKPEDFTIYAEVDDFWAEFFPDEPAVVMYTFEARLSEYWFMDYNLEISLDYDEESDAWYGFAFGSTYGGSATPLQGEGGTGSMGTSIFGSNSKYMGLYYDYAGNASVFEITGGDNLLNYVDLEADQTEIQVGETVTIRDVAENDFNTRLSWEVSDPTIAEIVENDDHSVTIVGLKKGTVTVYGGFSEYMAGIEITVTDPAFEAIKTQFKDIQNHWAKDDIAEAVYRGLFKGITDDTFAPNSPVTRGQLVTVLYRMEGEPEGAAKSGFEDVKDGAYYTDAINWAAENGIVNGVDDKTFAPNAPVTREQFATIVYRYAAYKELDVSAAADLSAYTDADTVSAYAKDAVAWAVASGLIKGVTADTIAPKSSATRAQAAVILVRFQDAFGI